LREGQPSHEVQITGTKNALWEAFLDTSVHGLDVCPDHGLEGYKRYVALAIVSRNIQKLGAIIRDRNRQRWHPAGAKAAS
jgi:hypothetical protein